MLELLIYEPRTSFSIIQFSGAHLLNSSQESSVISEPYERLPIGTKVQAVWSDDGDWYVHKNKENILIIPVFLFIYSILFIFFSVFD